MAKYEDINQWLREKIADGTFAIGDKIPSENELALMFGYSRQTVRQAIGLLEAEGILIRAQGSGTFVNRRAIKKNHSPTMRIGVIASCLDDFNFPGIIRGIESVLGEHHYTISLCITHNRQTNEETALRKILAGGVDGLIVEGTKTALPNVNELLYNEIMDRGIPLVFFNSYYRNFRESYVVMDDVRAGELATRALIRMGHTKIGGIFKSDDMQGLRRYKGMQDAMKKVGYSPSDQWLYWYTTEDLPYLFSGSLDSVLLSRFSGVTAMVCYNDQIAVALIRLLRQHAICVPDDVSIVSFDNSPLADVMSCNLTSVVYPALEIGQHAARLMLKKLAAPTCRDCIILTPELKQRSSILNLRDGDGKNY
ncbi:MAG: GntR family transcriptional regulator [Lachnospiraceae bacterium]|nr:GntR family transcriptional regulator [Lachnospiraceae bacterium]